MNDKYTKVFEKYGLNFARMLGSKSTYREIHPDNLVVFNSRIYTKDYYDKQKDKDIRDFFKGQEKEIWYGDVDFNKDIYKFYKVAYAINEVLVITSEMGNKIMEIGTKSKDNWIGHIGKKGITLKDFRRKKK